MHTLEEIYQRQATLEENQKAIEANQATLEANQEAIEARLEGRLSSSKRPAKFPKAWC